MQPEQKKILMGYFIVESKDLLKTLEKGILNLAESLEDSERLQELFRAAHSIKGGAAFLHIESIAKTAFKLEKCFRVIKEEPVEADTKLQALFLQALEFLRQLIEQMQIYEELQDEKMSEIVARSESTFEALIFYLDILVVEKKLS